MQRWTCPKCNRVFGKLNQGHDCQPGLTLQDYFAQARPFEQPIFDQVHAGLAHLDGLIVDPLSIGILLKNGPMFAELRAKTKWTAVGFSLGRRLESGRLSRKIVDYGKKHFHVINVTEPNQIDDELIEWLIEAYHLAGGTLSEYQRAGDDPPAGMVPDDVDEHFL